MAENVVFFSVAPKRPIGIIKQRVIVVAYTERDNGDTIRIISARKALKHEKKLYEEGIS
jgi:uncharacterized DUF497 family protein